MPYLIAQRFGVVSPCSFTQSCRGPWLASRLGPALQIDTAVQQHDSLGRCGCHHPPTLEHNLFLSTLLSIWNRPGCIPQRRTEKSQGKQRKVGSRNTALPIPQMWNRSEPAFYESHFLLDCSTICGITRSRFQQIHAFRTQSVPDLRSARYPPGATQTHPPSHGIVVAFSSNYALYGA